jgi:Na+-transporting NADH:ubiquinone oxidoreductase subunit NqrC|tara:strand:+ start:1542 stop:2009 length:468 start_codon:yes stop_codon:yes gene_type:complete
MNFYDTIFAIIGMMIILLVVAIQQIHADEMVHEFKSPSFSGVGTSSHYLTIENQETNRKEAIAEEIKALRDEIEREENNTVEARFMRNLTSRIYANIARQVEASLFGEDTNKSGSMELDGNTIEYEITDEEVKVTITDEDGNVTEVIVPVGGFTF